MANLIITIVFTNIDEKYMPNGQYTYNVNPVGKMMLTYIIEKTYAEHVNKI